MSDPMPEKPRPRAYDPADVAESLSAAAFAAGLSRPAGGPYARELPEPLSADELASLVRYDASGLVPCVVQQEGTGEVLMVAWMNAESLRLTLKTRTTWFWSRSRAQLWNKGATSGNMQQLRRLLVDCDGDTLVAVVDSPGPACHTGHRSCFYRELAPQAPAEKGE